MELLLTAKTNRVLGNLYTLTGRLPQLLQQLETILARQLQDRELAVSDGEYTGDPLAAISRAGVELDQATAAANPLTRALQAAQQAIAYVSVISNTDQDIDIDGGPDGAGQDGER